MHVSFIQHMEYIHVVDEYSIQNFYLKMKEKTVNKMCDPSSHLKLSFAMEEHSIGTDTPNIRRIKHFGPSSSLESKLMCYRKFIAHYLSLNYHNRFKFVYSVLARGRKRRKGWGTVRSNFLS